MGQAAPSAAVTDREPARHEDAPVGALPGEFTFWRGRSGRRYVFSVFPVIGRIQGERSCPDHEDAVVLAVRRERGGRRRVLFAADTGPFPALLLGGAALQAALAAGADEIHMHLLASDASERAALMTDIGG